MTAFFDVVVVEVPFVEVLFDPSPAPLSLPRFIKVAGVMGVTPFDGPAGTGGGGMI
jgi:hypothetical protein